MDCFVAPLPCTNASRLSQAMTAQSGSKSYVSRPRQSIDQLFLKDAAIVPSKLSLPQLSLAKDKIRVLLLEGVNDSAVQMIEAAGYSSMTRLSKALEGDALKEAIKGVHLLGIRSRTQITTDVLEAADRLIAIGCFSVGTNQVD